MLGFVWTGQFRSLFLLYRNYNPAEMIAIAFAIKFAGKQRGIIGIIPALRRCVMRAMQFTRPGPIEDMPLTP
jgi:hypothetical protein